MIKRTLIIAFILILFIFGGGAVVAFFSLGRFHKVMSLINIAQDSLLERQKLNDYVIRLPDLLEQDSGLKRESLLSVTSQIDSFLGSCAVCHHSDTKGPSEKEALFVIERIGILNGRLREMALSGEILTTEIRLIFDKLNELTTESLFEGRTLMSNRIEKGMHSLRYISILTLVLIISGGILLVFVFLKVRHSLEKNIFSIMRASEEIAHGRDVKKIAFSSDFESVRLAFLKLQQDLKNKEEEIKTIANRAAQAEKLTALGELVAGVSHELNNPLQIIVGYAEMGISDESMPEHFRTIFTRIYESAVRASKIVMNLREFARQREPVREPLDMRQIIDKVIDLLDYEFTSSGIEVIRDYSDIPLIPADQNQMQQFILNLLKNAYDAIVETGRGSGRIDISVKRREGRVIITISDTGRGIPHELINRIFEPFFTTKPIGKGTGLGLSITYGIIKSHNGTISVESKVGEGTTFTIELPVEQT